MRYLFVLLLLVGCGTLNSKSENHSCSEQKKACSCPGTQMECCKRNPDGTTPCTPDECNCKLEVMLTPIKVEKSGSCCK